MAPEGDKPAFVEGDRWEGDDADMRRRALAAAFDYRGDVTLLLRGGEEVVGYVSNCRLGGSEPSVDVLPSDGGPARTVRLEQIRGIGFSGKDTASGKSWETWVAKYQESQKARERGEDVGEVGLFPEPLE